MNIISAFFNPVDIENRVKFEQSLNAWGKIPVISCLTAVPVRALYGVARIVSGLAFGILQTIHYPFTGRKNEESVQQDILFGLFLEPFIGVIQVVKSLFEVFALGHYIDQNIRFGLEGNHDKISPEGTFVAIPFMDGRHYQHINCGDGSGPFPPYKPYKSPNRLPPHQQYQEV